MVTYVSPVYDSTTQFRSARVNKIAMVYSAHMPIMCTIPDNINNNVNAQTNVAECDEWKSFVLFLE